MRSAKLFLFLFVFDLCGTNLTRAGEETSAPLSEQEWNALSDHFDEMIETRRQFRDRLTNGPQVAPVIESLRESIAELDEQIRKIEQQLDGDPARDTSREPLPVSNETDASAPRPDKNVYTLFNPTPKELMREMSTDRPDKTESAYTVDAGHFQFESDLLTYSRAEERTDTGYIRSDEWAIAPVNLKLGLRNNMDLQLVIDTYATVDTEEHRNRRTRLRSAFELYDHLRTVTDANPLDIGNISERLGALIDGTRLVLNGDLRKKHTSSQSGFGDVTLRLKINVWGNDGGKTAFAMMPFVKLPTNQDDLGNDSVEGGVIFPLAVELPAGWGMGLMTEVDFLRNDADDDYYTAWINTITFSHDIVGNLGGYVEFFSEVSSESELPWVGTVDFGLTYAFTEDIQLDAGINIGITESADDYNPFLGLSWRF